MTKYPFTNAYRSHGKVFHYYRRGVFRRRLPGEPGSPEFNAAYEAADAQFCTPGAKRNEPVPRSLSALILSYRKTPEWSQLKPATRRDYGKALTPLHEQFGALPVEGLERMACDASTGRRRSDLFDCRGC
jgi:hypothetical protein